MQGGKSTIYWWTVVQVIDSSSHFDSESGENLRWSANVADRGKKFVFLPWKETDLLFSKDVPTCISTENVNLFKRGMLTLILMCFPHQERVTWWELVPLFCQYSSLTPSWILNWIQWNYCKSVCLLHLVTGAWCWKCMSTTQAVKLPL